VTQFKISSVVNATLLLQDGFVIVLLLCSGPLLWFWFHSEGLFVDDFN
jgi:hypothetical protein